MYDKKDGCGMIEDRIEKMADDLAECHTEISIRGAMLTDYEATAHKMIDRGYRKMDNEKYAIYEVRSEMWECDKKHFPNQLAFRIQWVANIGFGELTFIYNTKTNTWSVDDEHMSEEFCKAVLFKWLNGVYTGENAVSKLDYGE